MEKTDNSNIQRKILIMDDDPLICEILSDILSELGYLVTITNEGNESINQFQNSVKIQNMFDLVILDLTVNSGLNGLETAKKLFELEPKVKIILSSGMMDHLIEEKDKKYFIGKLNKPYTFEEVQTVIESTIKK